MKRVSEVNRITAETDIFIRLNIDGKGEARLNYPVGFMGHMLNTFARHGLFDLEINAKGDLEVDQHHLIEDTGLVLGQCFAKALGDKKGIVRAGDCLFPMDETLARAVVDISGRPFLVFESADEFNLFGDSGASGFQFDTVIDFWQAFVNAAGITMHLDILRGRSVHHKTEAIFKAAARALRDACGIDSRCADIVPSTKGVLA